jgi:hypothetical protein
MAALFRTPIHFTQTYSLSIVVIYYAVKSGVVINPTRISEFLSTRLQMDEIRFGSQALFPLSGKTVNFTPLDLLYEANLYPRTCRSFIMSDKMKGDDNTCKIVGDRSLFKGTVLTSV